MCVSACRWTCTRPPPRRMCCPTRLCPTPAWRSGRRNTLAGWPGSQSACDNWSWRGRRTPQAAAPRQGPDLSLEDVVVAVRKHRAGSDSFGHTWPGDGSVVDVPLDEAGQLVSIPDGGFSIVDDPAPEPARDVDESPPPRRGGRKAKVDTVEEGAPLAD